MNVWFWSDLHLGHVKLAEQWRADFGGTVELHNAALASAWRSTVHPADTVVIVGDVIMGRFDEGLALLDSLPGRKVLIPGNHDRYHPSYAATETKRINGRKRYEGVVDAREELVVDGSEFGLTDTIICHFPWKGTEDHTEGARDLIDVYGPEPADYPGKVLIHGHTHSTARLGPMSVHVGVDAWAKPVHAVHVGMRAWYMQEAQRRVA